MQTVQCLKVLNGIIALVCNVNNSQISLKNNNIFYELKDYGIIVKNEYIEIPLPCTLLDYLTEIKEPIITLYELKYNSYISEAILSIQLSQKSLIEAQGAYNFWKSQIIEG